MTSPWWSSGQILLDESCPLPLEEPFTGHQAAQWGVSRSALGRLHAAGHLRRVLQGVYAATQAPDTLLVRARALRLVVPEHAVVTDRTAAWLHGVAILPRSAPEQVPPLQVFHTIDTRMRRPGVVSGRRDLLARDTTKVHGLRVTTPLRTVIDLGRLLWRYDALAAIDGFLRIGVPHEELLSEMGRFRGYRGIRQLRSLAPLGDALAESPGESALRLHWYDAGLPTPQLQRWVADDVGVDRYRLDLSEPVLRFAAEYDGLEHHSRTEDREADATRRAWLSDRGWTIAVFTKTDVYDFRPDPIQRLRAGRSQARRRVARWRPGRPISGPGARETGG